MAHLDFISPSLFEAKVTYYPSVRNRQGQEVTLWDMISRMTGPEWRDKVEAVRCEQDEKERKALKQLLPGFTASGSFRERKNEGLIKHSGFICIDIDAKENPDCEDFGKLKEAMRLNPNVAYCGLSAGGKGYFCLIPIADPRMHAEYFAALEADFARCGLKVDRACKDIARFRFVSYDPAPYINTGAVPYDRILRPKEEPRVPRPFIPKPETPAETPEESAMVAGMTDEATFSLFRAVLEWVEHGKATRL